MVLIKILLALFSLLADLSIIGVLGRCRGNAIAALALSTFLLRLGFTTPSSRSFLP